MSDTINVPQPLPELDDCVIQDALSRPAAGPRQKRPPEGAPRLLKKVGAGFSVPIRAGKDADGKANQFRLTLETHDRIEAARCLTTIERMRDALVKLGRGAEAEVLMRHAARHAADPVVFAQCIDRAAVATTLSLRSVDEFDTWGKLAVAWGEGRLHELYPREVPHKASSDTDLYRINHLKNYIGGVPLVAFCKADLKHAMANLPETTVRDTAERQYAQVICKVLRIATKLEIIKLYPLDATSLPKISKRHKPIFTYLYPVEDAALLACPTIPLCWRVLWGFITREGLRISEARRIRWKHIDRKAGKHGEGALKVNETKTGRALHWVLQPGTLEALDSLRELSTFGPFGWLTKSGKNKAPATLRRHLLEAKQERDELHNSEGRQWRMREHDLRATFITLALLADKSEAWIMRHTGHASSTQIQAYNHARDTAAEMGFEQLVRLDVALGIAPGSTAGGGDANPPAARSAGASEGAADKTDALPEPASGSSVTLSTNGCDSPLTGVGGTGQESSMFSAVVRERGVEPPRLAALEPKSVTSGQEPTKQDGLLTTRMLGSAADCPLSQGGVTVIPSSEPLSLDPSATYLAMLEATAHAALSAGKSVTELAKLIDAERHRAAPRALTLIADARQRRDEKGQTK